MAKSAAARSPQRASKRQKKPRAHLRVVTDESVAKPRWREFGGVGLLALSILVGLSLFSYNPAAAAWPGAADSGNLIGPVGALLAELLLAGFGVGAYMLAGGLLLFGVFCFTPKRVHIGGLQVAGLAICLVGASTIAHIVLSQVTDISYPPGGLLGAITGDSLARYLAPMGTAILAGAAVAIGILLATDISVGSLVTAVSDGSTKVFELGVDLVQTQRQRLKARAEKRVEKLAQEQEAQEAAERAEREAAEKRAERKRKRQEAVRAKAEALAEADLKREAEQQAQAEREAAEAAEAAAKAAVEAAEKAAQAVEAPVSESPDGGAVAGGDESSPQAEANTVAAAAPTPLQRQPIADPPWVADLEVHDTIPGCEAEKLEENKAAAESSAPRIVEFKPRTKREQKKLVESASDERPKPYGDAFELPPLNLLDYDAPEVEPLDKNALAEESRKLVKKFKDYGIEGHVREIRPGPVVTTYEFVPAAGTRIARIASLADDLAMAMEAIRVRVVAPIPGKGAVGIEIPNEKRQSVYLKEIIASSGFQRSPSKLAMALGKDIEGRPYHVDLAKMPHMLIAGTTGSGKSVAVNAMITSILYKATPDEVRFLMIDPKMLELAIYEGIPHLLLPPVTDPKKAAVALRWAVEEMERRYQLMAETGVRDIIAFNKKVTQLREGQVEPPKPAKDKKKKVLIRDERDSVIGKAEDFADDAAEAQAEGPDPVDPSTIPERLPYIVVVLDEFADLMMVAPRDVEAYVARLAQKARACGIHLLLATQRPSTDVITGVIKANFPVRMSFQVASNHDSKTIINAYGAEKLLGKGDMLLIPPGTSTLMRCHGAFISDVEIKRLVDMLKTQGAPSYDENILKAGEEDKGPGGDEEEEYDEHYDSAVAIVAETRQVSISMIQRRLKIGYNRAARIVERMERDGLVGPQPSGNKPREVFVQHISD